MDRIDPDTDEEIPIMERVKLVPHQFAVEWMADDKAKLTPQRDVELNWGTVVG